MNKSELVRVIRDELEGEITLSQIEAVLDALGDAVSERLKNGETVALPGIGKLEAQDRPARNGRNPRTGESLVIPARRNVRLKVGKPLQSRVNGER